MKIFFMTSHPFEGAAPRYRVYQYLPYLKEKGIEFKIRPFISDRLFKVLYSKQHRWKKTFYFLIDAANRYLDLIRVLNYDIVFIQRETFPIGPPIIEFILSKILLKQIIYDFDDAIFISETKGIFSFFRNPDKIKKIISWADYIIAGNKYLKEYAVKFNKNIKILPTSIETKTFLPAEKNDDNKEKDKKADKIVIGWIGSHSTTRYLIGIIPVLAKLAEKYKFKLKIVGASKEIKIPGVEVINQEWSLSREVNDFQDLTIGIYPLPENKWTLGKCGFKAIQYMAMGIPTIASPVGINREIIKDGIDGFLAEDEEEWLTKLSMLIENEKLRKLFASAGRKTIEQKYSVSTNFSIFNTVINQFNKINILQLISGLDIGGTERMLVELVNGTNKLKYNMTVCSIKSPSSVGEELKKIKNIKIISLNAKSKLNFLIFFKIIYLIKKNHIDLIQSYLFFDNFVARITGMLVNIPVITGHRAVEPKREKWRAFLLRLTNCLDNLVIANSFAGREDLINNLKTSKSKIKVIHNGKNISRYNKKYNRKKVLEKINIKGKSITIGIIGRLHEQKGHEYFLKSAAEISNPKTKFLIVGNGPLMEKMKKLTQELKIQNKVFFLGEIKDIRPLLYSMDIFVLSSLWEGLPGAILEAMIMSKPVVATNVDGSKELVVNNQNGFLVPPRNPSALAEKIEVLIKDKKLREKMGAAGKSRAEKFFTAERMVKEYENVYKMLIKRKLNETKV